MYQGEQKLFFQILLCHCDLLSHPRSKGDMPNESVYPNSDQ